jgi:molecular chaperone GrpE
VAGSGADPRGTEDAAAAAADDGDRPASTEAGEVPAPEETQAPDPVAELGRERDELLDLAQRTKAEFENYRKRAAKEMAAAGERAKAALVRELLPAVDNLERALAAGDADATGLTEGVKLVHAELVGALERNGVKGFVPVGEQFDPSLHEALSTRADEGAESGVVLEVVEKGYRSDDAVLRPARVVVSA